MLGGAGAKGRNWVVVTLGGLALTLVAFVVVVVILSQKEHGFDFSMDGTGKLTVSAKGAPLSQVIEQAMAEHPHTVLNALRELDGRSEEHRAVREGIRQILWDAKGPFSPPDVLAGADQRLYESAVLELNNKLRDFTPDDPDAAANAFVTRMILDQLDREGLFKDRLFRAKVVKVDGVAHARDGDRHVVFVCADSKLRDRSLILMPNDPSVPRHMKAIPVVARVDPGRFDDCYDPPQSMGRYLAQQAAHIGVAAQGFVSFAYGEDGEQAGLPAEVAAKFQVIPKYHVFRPDRRPQPQVEEARR
jgi:hypothetical protein